MKRKILVSAVLSVLLLAALAANVHAAEVKITASDGAAEDYFGRSVAISGDYAVVGAYGNDDAGSSSGSAYIFKHDGTAWTEQAKITASDGAAEDYFGYSVAISGDYAVVGAHYDDDTGTASGSAHIFKRDGTAWTEQAKITASDGAAEDYFGRSVAISGDYAVVGSHGDNDASSRSGSAHIFKRDGIAWTEQAKITASDGAEDDWFGTSVAISGDYAVVGASGNDAGSGSSYIFKRDGIAWTEQAKITASDGTADDHFGISVAILGGYAVAGAYYDNDVGSCSGSAYIFKRDGTAWTEQAKINASDGAAGDWFGGRVAISADCAVVSAYRDDDAGSCSGSAYIYDIPIGIFSCDSDGNQMDQFAPGETVYATGNSLPASTSYKLWIQDEAVCEGNALATSEDPSGAQESVNTDASGTLPVTAIWAIDPCAAVTYTEYDIVADNQAAGVVGTYHASSDLLDSSSVAGIATIPDTTAPASITSLDSATYEQTYTNWTWTDPADADFLKVIVYLDGIYKEDVLKGVQCYNATGLTADTEHEIATRTVDNAGNINATWVNDTARVTEVKIAASDGTEDDHFGASVAISGDYAVVGAYGNDDAGTDSGSAYIFKRDATEWTEQAKITASDGAADDWFGYSVAISGDYAVVGAYGNDDAGSDSGSAYIYDIPDTTAPTLNITSFAPPSPVIDTEGAAGAFSITVNQTANVSWLINGTEVQTNESVTSTSYTNTSAAPGVWNVSAIASNANSTAMQTWWWTVLANTPPTASFTFSPSYPFVGHLVTFNGSDSSDPDGFITSYEWNFGDGNTSTGMVVTHSYSSAGTYVVTLEVTDNDERTGTKTIDVQYGEQPTRGDVNGDGYITSADAAIVLEIAVRGSASCDAATLDAADVNSDGSVTSLDALMILQAAAGSINIG